MAMCWRQCQLASRESARNEDWNDRCPTGPMSLAYLMIPDAANAIVEPSTNPCPPCDAMKAGLRSRWEAVTKSYEAVKENLELRQRGLRVDQETLATWEPGSEGHKVFTSKVKKHEIGLKEAQKLMTAAASKLKDVNNEPDSPALGVYEKMQEAIVGSCNPEASRVFWYGPVAEIEDTMAEAGIIDPPPTKFPPAEVLQRHGEGPHAIIDWNA